MVPPPPKPTLFPYTTLFRSRELPRTRHHHLLHPADRASQRGRKGPVRRAGTPRDRKSTRLNSSHEWISYAVFCLKKKKSSTQINARRDAHAGATELELVRHE